MTWARRNAVPLASAAIALTILLPLLRPGFVLSYDMAFVPRPRLSADLLGLGRNLARGVPFGLLVALASRVMPGEIVEKLVLAGIFVAGAWGAARLVPVEHTAARLASGVLYSWNPFTYERLLLGHAPFLLSYAALPWVVSAALRLRKGEPTAFPGMVVAIGVASFASPYGGLFAVATALLVVLCPPKGTGERRAWAGIRVAVAGLVLNLPWLLPSVLRPGGVPAARLGFDLFKSRSDSPLGALGSLLSLGGLWRSDLSPPGRSGWAWAPAFLLIAGFAVLGWRRLRASLPLGAAAGLGLAAALGLLLAWGVSAPLVGGSIRWLGLHFPGGAALRDSQKFVAPLALAMAVGFGVGVDRFLTGLRDPSWARALALPLVILPVALAPTLAWGASGRLSAVEYPSSWTSARELMARDPQPGAVLVLPWHLHLPFGWNDGRVVIQPASAFFTRPAVESDALEVGRYRLPPEDPWSALADPAVLSGQSLAALLPQLGVRYVLLLKEADWLAFRGRVAGLELAMDTSELSLYVSGQPAREIDFPSAPAVPVIAGDLAALALFVAALSLLLARRR